ncbi:MAG: hypothetical protein PHW02_02850 [bacterium]|nr:hypothetical protein [bacterium]
MRIQVIIIILIFSSCSFLGRPPSDIIILMPEDKATWQQANVQLVWQCENADIFKLYFSENEESLELVSEQTGSAYELVGLSERTTYFWKVIGENNVASKESGVYSFTTGTKPDPVTTLNLPDSNEVINEPNVSVSWERAAYADSYYVEIATDTMFMDLFLGQMFDDTICYHDDFYPHKRYYWRVQSWNSFGGAPWSPVHWFDIFEYVP